jgi:dihydroneopterin aldolase
MSLMFGRSISEREWQSRLPFASDKVTIKSLHMIANAGFDVWGRQKVQPVDISVSLSLTQASSSAAASDTVDASTVHYGQLSKSIMARVQQSMDKWSTPEELAYSTTLAALEAAPNHSLLAGVEVDVRFTKATLYGEGMSLLFSFSPEADSPSNGCSSEILHLARLHVPALIGVNSNERTMKQMVVVSLWIDRVNPLIVEHCFELEQVVFKVSIVSRHLTSHLSLCP